MTKRELSSLRFRPHWNPESPWQVIGLLHLVHAVFADNPSAARWLEIGSYAGESATLILGHPGVKLLHCVDAWDAAAEAVRRRLAGPIQDGRAEVFQCKSLEFASRGNQYDVVYVDADHSYDSVREEIAAFAGAIAPGGHIAGHDYGDSFPGVRKAVDEFRQDRPVRLFQDGSWLVRV